MVGGGVWKSNPPFGPRRVESPALKAGKVTGPLSPPLEEYHQHKKLTGGRKHLSRKRAHPNARRRFQNCSQITFTPGWFRVPVPASASAAPPDRKSRDWCTLHSNDDPKSSRFSHRVTVRGPILRAPPAVLPIRPSALRRNRAPRL